MKRSVFAIAAAIGFNGILNTACSEAKSAHTATSASAKADTQHQPEKIKSQADVNTPKSVVTGTAMLSDRDNEKPQAIEVAALGTTKPIETAEPIKAKAATRSVDTETVKPEVKEKRPIVEPTHSAAQNHNAPLGHDTTAQPIKLSAPETQVQEVQVQETVVKDVQRQAVQVQAVQVSAQSTQAQSTQAPQPQDNQTQPIQLTANQSAQPAEAEPLQAKTAPVKHLIEIKKFKFSIPKLDVKVGDEVTWINLDIVPHTATALDESWDSGELKKGESYTMVITDNISLAYFCLYHRQMKAEFVMKDES